MASVAKWHTASRTIFAGVVAGLFFPLAALLGLPARSTVTPLMFRKAVWAGSNLGSYRMGEEAIDELVGASISAKRIRRMVSQIGGERVAEREAAVAELAKIAEKTGGCDTMKPSLASLSEPSSEMRYEPPELISREVLASGVESESFGHQLAARAWQRGFPGAERLAFVADGAPVNWTIQQINRRVKGSEKFWSQPTSEAVLQLRADYLSASTPLDSFWLRHQARQTGTNAYTQTT